MGQTTYKHIGRRYGSRYRQFFINDTKHRAENMWAETLGDDARTPEQVAADFGVPVEAVYECIHYCENNPDVLQQDYEMEQETLQGRPADAAPGSRRAVTIYGADCRAEPICCSKT